MARKNKEVQAQMLYTLKDAGDIAGVSAATLRNDFDAGLVAGFRLSDNERVIPGEQLVLYIAERQKRFSRVAP